MQAAGALLQRKFGLRRWLLLSGAVLAVLFGVAATLAVVHWPFTRARIVRTLEEESSGRVTIQGFRKTFWPHPGCIAEGVVIRQNAHPDAPPLITIPQLSIEGSYSHILTVSRHLRRIRADKIHIRVPAAREHSSRTSTKFEFDIGEMLADEALLEFAGAPGKKPFQIQIDRVRLAGIREKRPLSFQTQLRIPEPPGLVVASGEFGPWQSADPYKTPVAGTYTFTRANLGVFEGISGQLSSAGKFEGVIDHINVQGSAELPDFMVKSVGHPVHLKTTFRAVVNGRNGDTHLHGVDSEFRRTRVVTHGSIADAAHVRGKTVALDMSVEQGRIEDFLRLLTHAARPAMTGALAIRARVVLPPEERRFVQKLRLRGDFSIRRALFTAPPTREGIDRISRRAQDQQEPGDDADVVSDLKGHVELANGVARFSNVSFEFPGAFATLSGNCNLVTERFDLHGTVRLEENLSDTAKGMKRIFLKVLDPLFKKKRRRISIVPVKITGSFSHPSLQLDLKKL